MAEAEPQDGGEEQIAQAEQEEGHDQSQTDRVFPLTTLFRRMDCVHQSAHTSSSSGSHRNNITSPTRADRS